MNRKTGERVSLLAGLVLMLALALTPAPGQAQGGKWTPEEQMKVKTVGAVVPSPDGKRVAYTVNEAVMDGEKSEVLTHIWMATADGADTWQFTGGEKSASNPRWSPDGKWIAFTTSRSGKNNVWRIRAAGGEAEQVTDVKSGVNNFAWSPDGNWIAFTMNDPPSDAEEKARKEKNDANVVDENFKMSHLWVIAVEKPASAKREARQITRGSFHVGGFDCAPDGRSIAFSHQPTPRVNDWPSADVSVVDVASGERKTLAATAAAESSPEYSPDGKWIAYVASDVPVTWANATYVHVVPGAGGTARKLAATPDQLPNLLGWSADGKWVYVTETRGTVTRLSALATDGSAARDISSGDGVAGGTNLNRSATAAGFSWQASDRAPEAYVTRLDNYAPVQVSKANASLPGHATGRTEVVKWKGADGMEIEGLLTYPVGFEKGKRYPMLVVIHGGPAGVFTQSYLAGRGVYPLATYAAEGYAVLRPNIRGSGGYGKKFRHANVKDWGGKDYQDLMAGVDHVISMGVADADRLGVMGWSYGGYMTSWVITQTRRFKAASIGAPVTNLMSFTGTTDIPGFVPDYFGAEFWENPDIYKQHSAMFNVKGVTTPSLIQHGERDERVHIAQGMELYNALRRQGVETRMVTYPRMPHGLSEPKLQMDAAKRNLEWFAKFVPAGK